MGNPDMVVILGLDPRIQEKQFELADWILGSSPRMTTSVHLIGF